MPCQDYGAIADDVAENRRRLDEYAVMLCEQCELIESLELDEYTFTDKVRKWWVVHKAADAEQKRLEAIEEAKIKQSKINLFNELKQELGL